MPGATLRDHRPKPRKMHGTTKTYDAQGSIWEDLEALSGQLGRRWAGTGSEFNLGLQALFFCGFVAKHGFHNSMPFCSGTGRCISRWVGAFHVGLVRFTLDWCVSRWVGAFHVETK